SISAIFAGVLQILAWCEYVEWWEARGSGRSRQGNAPERAPQLHPVILPFSSAALLRRQDLRNQCRSAEPHSEGRDLARHRYHRIVHNPQWPSRTSPSRLPASSPSTRYVSIDTQKYPT